MISKAASNESIALSLSFFALNTYFSNEIIVLKISLIDK